MDSNTEIIIMMGDITDSDVDGIVNAANTHLVLGSGVAGSIRRKGGPSIQAECDKLGRIPLGEAAVTGAGMLKARYVIHAAGMHPGGVVTSDSLESATLSSLKRADQMGIRSIAFPAIGTGVGGFPMEECAMVMISAVWDYLREETSRIEKIYFVLFDEPSFRTFERESERIRKG